MDDERESPSLKQKLRSSLCLSCCFRSPRQDEAFEYYGTPRSAKESSAPWTRSRAHEFPEIKEKCRNLISRMGKGRRHSADFRYDPLSYALNFDDDNEDEFPLKNFSARLPPSPPTVSTSDGAAKPVAVSREILGFS